MPPPTSSDPPVLPKQFYHLGTRHPNIWTYRGCSHSNHYKVQLCPRIKEGWQDNSLPCGQVTGTDPSPKVEIWRSFWMTTSFALWWAKGRWKIVRDKLYPLSQMFMLKSLPSVPQNVASKNVIKIRWHHGDRAQSHRMKIQGESSHSSARRKSKSLRSDCQPLELWGHTLAFT